MAFVEVVDVVGFGRSSRTTTVGVVGLGLGFGAGFGRVLPLSSFIIPPCVQANLASVAGEAAAAWHAFSCWNI